MTNLWTSNHPRYFWQCQPDPPDEIWQDAIAGALPALGLTDASPEADSILALTLGEARFGPDHWNLGAIKRAYYLLKPVIPRPLTRWMRQRYSPNLPSQIPWPVEARYVTFLWEVLRQVLLLEGRQAAPIRDLWPGKNDFALVLTHDIETAKGQQFVKEVVALEQELGFRSSFNFVPERYPVDANLMNELCERGFEVGVHGLKHDGKLFTSQKTFERNAKRINQHLKDWRALGFRADLTHRQPEWMQRLDVEYDLSFFDTDPYEPIPGGTMSIWPFFMGRLVELPYTLVQDYTLTSILNERTPHLWLDKVDFIENYHGMALVNSHPDYLQDRFVWNVYQDFLTSMKKRRNFWHALPHQAAGWWRSRACTESHSEDGTLSRAAIENGQLKIETEVDSAVHFKSPSA